MKVFSEGVLTKFDQEALIEDVLLKYDDYTDELKKKWRDRKQHQFLKWGLLYYPKHCVDKARTAKCHFQLSLHGNG